MLLFALRALADNVLKNMLLMFYSSLENEGLLRRDHGSSTLIPTVLLSHEIPNNIDNSWYRGVPYVYLKLAATEPSFALRKASEVKWVLISKFGENNIPPIVILYTDGGPEHRATFLSVKIAMTALQRALNAVLLVALRTASGHSFRNPVEKVNCILNLGLYGIGVMRQSIYEDMVFEKMFTHIPI